MGLSGYLYEVISRKLLKRSQKWQRQSEVRDLGLWDIEINENGNIAVQGLDTTKLVEMYGSPLLVVNKRRLLHDAHEIQQALSGVQ